MFIWGSGHQTRKIPANSATPCPSCGVESEHMIQVDYDYSHIFGVFKSVKKKIVQLLCEHCGASTGVSVPEEKQLFRSLGHNPIPFMDRHGALLLKLIIFMAVAYIVFVWSFPCAVNSESSACKNFHLLE